MGKFDFEVDPAFLRQLGRLAEVEKYAPKMIDGAVPILSKNVKTELAKHKRTGDMLNSVRLTKSKKNKKGQWYAVVRPTGKDRDGVRNMEKLAHAEYGTKNQSPTPILSKAINDSKPEVEAKMREVFEEEIKK